MRGQWFSSIKANIWLWSFLCGLLNSCWYHEDYIIYSIRAKKNEVMAHRVNLDARFRPSRRSADLKIGQNIRQKSDKNDCLVHYLIVIQVNYCISKATNTWNHGHLGFLNEKVASAVPDMLKLLYLLLILVNGQQFNPVKFIGVPTLDFF